MKKKKSGIAIESALGFMIWKRTLKGKNMLYGSGKENVKKGCVFRFFVFLFVPPASASFFILFFNLYESY